MHNKYKQLKEREVALEKKLLTLENHCKDHPRDYTSIISRECVYSDLVRVRHSITETLKKMEQEAYNDFEGTF